MIGCNASMYDVSWGSRLRSGVLSAKGYAWCRLDGRVLIDNVDLLIEPGEVIELLGGLGAGKSTFVRSVLFEREVSMRY